MNTNNTDQTNNFHNSFLELAKDFENRANESYAKFSYRDPHGTKGYEIVSEIYNKAAEDIRDLLHELRNGN